MVTRLSRMGNAWLIAALASLALAGPLAGVSKADNILITQFDFTGYVEMEANLEAAGHTVTIVDARINGTLAAALGLGTFDQVYLFDLTSSLYLDGADLAALVDFYGDHSGIVVDSRSYGYHFQPNQASEVALLQNVAANLSLSGGGVWVGTDHAPTWTNNGNAFLNAVGLNPVTGVHSEPVNTADPASVLLSGVTPTDLWGGGQSIGTVSLGVQPNGTELFFHFGHTRADGSLIPYIAASFDLQGPDPDPIPEPVSMLLMGGGLAFAVARRRRAARKA